MPLVNNTGFTSVAKAILMQRGDAGENEEAVVAAPHSVDSAEGSIADQTEADELLRGLAEAIGENPAAQSALGKSADLTQEMMMQRHAEYSSAVTPDRRAGSKVHFNNVKSSGRRGRHHRRNSAGAKKQWQAKYTLVDLVENINTDVKSEVADFDFETASKKQVVNYFQEKVEQI